MKQKVTTTESQHNRIPIQNRSISENRTLFLLHELVQDKLSFIHTLAPAELTFDRG